MLGRLNKVNKNYERNNDDKDSLSKRTDKSSKFKFNYEANNKEIINNDIELNKDKYKKEKVLIFKKTDLIIKKSKPIKESEEMQLFIERSDSVEIVFNKNNKKNYENKLKEFKENDLDLICEIQSAEKELHSSLRFVNNDDKECWASNLKTPGKSLQEIEINSKGDLVSYEHKKDSAWTGLRKQKYLLDDDGKIILKIKDVDSTKSNILTRTAKSAGGFTEDKIKSFFIENEEYFEQDKDT